MSGQSSYTHTASPVAVLLLAILLQACGGGGAAGGDEGSGGSGGSGGGGSGGGAGQGAEPPTITIANAALAEGDAATVDLTFDVTLSSALGEAVTVDYASADQSATAGDDYTEVDDTLTIPAGATSAGIAVSVNGDTCFEEDETFQIMLSNASGNAQLGTGVATGSIGNDDNKPELELADAEMAEGDDGVNDMSFTISLDRESCFDIEGTYTANSVTADEQDLAIESRPFVFPGGATQTDIAVEITGDTFYETDETFTVNLENVSEHVQVIDGEAFGTIRTDDLPPVTVLPAEIVEGDDNPRIMVFPVELAGITNEITVDYATSDITATIADNDYVETEGTLTVPAGVTTATIEVEIIGDTNPELHEEFLVTLSNIAGDAVLEPATDRAIGRIEDDDTVTVLDPEISVPPAFGFEGDDSTVTTEMLFQVTLNVPVAGDVELNYVTGDVTATAGIDYDATNGTVVIPAGDTFALVAVDVRGDTDEEGPELLALNLELVTQGLAMLLTPEATGTILDDDITGPPFLSVQPVKMFEGDSGVREMTVFVTLGGPAADTVTVDYATRDATALAGSDYRITAGTLTFEPGETENTFTVAILGDTVIEADERFELVLSNMSGDAILFTDVANATIESDDPFAMVTIDDVVLPEGDSGTGEMLFTVSLDAPAGDPVTLDYESADAVTGNSAAAGEDYTPVSGVLTILPGETEDTIAVQISGDTDNEFDEAFTVQLSNVSQNAELADPVGEGRIVNDDDTPGWGTSQYFTSDRDDNVLPEIVMNAAGDATVVWAPNTPGPYTSRRYVAGGGWGTPETPPESLVSGFMRVDRDLCIDGGGATTLGWVPVAQVAWHTVASSWDSVSHAFDPASNQAEFIRLAGNEAGNVIAVWKQNVPGASTTDHLMFSIYDPVLERWSDEDFIVFEGSIIFTPDVAVNADGVAIAVWRESDIRASRYDPLAGTWSEPVSISDELAPGIHEPGYAPKVAIDDDGNAIAVWDTGLSLGTSVTGSVWASRYDAAGSGQWEEAIAIELGMLDATNAQVAMDAAGNAFVVWLQDNDGTDGFNDTFEIRARRYVAATDGWEPEVVVQDTNTRVSSAAIDLTYDALDTPALAVDPAGNAVLAWSEDINGEFVIRASRYDIDEPIPAWSPPEPVSGDAWPFAMFPDIAIDAAGNAIVVWQAGDSGAFDSTDVSQIGWNRYTAP